LNQASNKTIQAAQRPILSIARPAKFLKRNNGLDSTFGSPLETLSGTPRNGW
jgi:hypothetical protein